MLKKFISSVCVIALYGFIFSFLFKGASTNMTVMSENSGAVKLPIVMYHSILKDPNRSGKYVITPDTLDSDIKYLYSKGYTTVSMAQVIDYVENNSPLPEKPVMLTFDDGCYNNLFYGVPILKDNNARGIFSIVGSYTDEYTELDLANITYGYMRWSDVYEMFVSENCEVGNHSYNFHNNTAERNGSKKNNGESSEQYKQIFLNDTTRVQDEAFANCGFYPYIYTYPYGLYSEESFTVLKEMGFKASLSCNEGVNEITHDSECLYLLKRYNRPSGISQEQFFSQMLE